jgi:hypothetical protein
MDARALILVVASTGCLRETQFRCESNQDCGDGARCEAVGFCSFPDSSCDGTQFRFGDSAGALANTCVGAEGGIDGGVEPDTAPVACPADFMTVAGADHKYKLVAADDWVAAEAACRVTPNAYLAIPDDAAELTAQETITANAHWIGVSDRMQEGTFQNVKGMTAFVQFGPGEPDNNPGNQDCVAVASTSMNTEPCNVTLPYICECED